MTSGDNNFWNWFIIQGECSHWQPLNKLQYNEMGHVSYVNAQYVPKKLLFLSLTGTDCYKCSYLDVTPVLWVCAEPSNGPIASSLPQGDASFWNLAWEDISFWNLAWEDVSFWNLAWEDISFWNLAWEDVSFWNLAWEDVSFWNLIWEDVSFWNLNLLVTKTSAFSGCFQVAHMPNLVTLELV